MTAQIESMINRDGEVSIIELMLLLWKEKWLIFLIAFGFAVTGFVATLFMKPVYLCSATFVAKTSEDPAASQLAGIGALVGIPFRSQTNKDPSLYLPEVLKDKIFLLSYCSKKWKYKNDSLFFSQIWGFDKKLSKEASVEAVIGELRQGRKIALSLDRKTNLMVLWSAFENPHIAYQVELFTLDLINEYINNNLKTQAHENRVFIEKRIAEIKNELNLSENELAFYSEKNVSSDVPRVALQKQRLLRNVAITQEIYLQLRKQYEMACLEEKKDRPLIEIIRNPEIPRNKSRPQKKLIVIVCLFCGVFVGFVSAFIKNTFSKYSAKLIGSQN